MLRNTLRHIRQNAVAWLALFVALGGTGAYAANTIGTGDIIDNQVTTADVRDDTLGFGGLSNVDLGPGSVRGSEVLNSSLGGGDIADSTLSGVDIDDNSLTGSDVNEATLSLPPTTTATFAQGSVSAVGNAMTRVAGKTVPGGSYAVTATASVGSSAPFAGDIYRDSACELRNGTGFIGGTSDRRETPDSEVTRASLSLNGGAQVPAGGGEISLWCSYQGGASAATNGQIMIIRLDGFF